MNHIETLERRTLLASFTLMNADTNGPLFTVVDGQTVDYAKLPTRNLSVRFNPDATPGSVMFGLNGVARYHNENNAPYSLTGAVGDDYTAWRPSLGRHVVTATPWSGRESTGTPGATHSLALNFADNPIVQPPPPTTPPPPGVTFEWVLLPNQSPTSIAPRPGDDVLVEGNRPRLAIPWSGTAAARVHVHFSGTIGQGQAGTVLSGGQYLHLHRPRVAGVRNGLQVANAAAKVGTGTIVSDGVFEDNTGTGLGIQGSNILVERTTFQRNGQQGFVIINSNGVTLRASKILNNNPGLVATPPWANQYIEGYRTSYLIGGKWYVNPDFEAGGNKIWASNNVRLENNEAAFNVGPGLWTDYLNTNITMTGNWAHDNRGLDAARGYQGEGIRLELSPSAGGFTITNNVTERNTGAGITLTSIRDVVIRGNRFVGGIGVLFRNDDGRGALTNITVTQNTFVGSTITTWGNRFPMTNVVTTGNTFI